MTTDGPRLIEHAFPLKQASLDSVHEKNVRHGHISTLHIWPARRPLAACRAALIATLLPDPGDPEKRRELIEKVGGRTVQKIEKKKMPSGKSVETIKEETIGGVLHWGRETENRETLEWFREEIKKAYGGRAPKVLDPFAGGGAIPLEAMRLGCEATAMDINPVAWFVLKCTLEYPQRLAGQKRRLPDFILKDREFMEAFFKSQGIKGALLRTQLERLGLGEASASDPEKPKAQFELIKSESVSIEADLAWHVRAWGKWVLEKARRDLEKFYPVVGGKPTVAYLWARTVKCKNCRATLPLLKTRWLCKKDKKRVLLLMEPNKENTAVVFGVQNDVPVNGGNAAQRREHDKRIGAGTMTRSGATCPCCRSPVAMTMEDIRQEGKAGRLGAVMTAVVVDGPNGKEYRLPAEREIRMAGEAGKEVERIFEEIPFGVPGEPLPSKEALGFRVPLYGFDQWHKLFTGRQLAAVGTFVKQMRLVRGAVSDRDIWTESLSSYMAALIDKAADYTSGVCTWHNSGEKMRNTFARFALPISWDIAELAVINEVGGAWMAQLDWIARYIEHALAATTKSTGAKSILSSATNPLPSQFDVILTDPPYYDAIPYSDLMDFFYVWLRRTLHGLSPEMDAAFNNPLAPKWDHDANDGELIDDASRHGGDRAISKAAYEDGMFRVFQACNNALNPEGRLVIVFAHKHPDAWETLVSAIIRAGFVVNGSWPIQTEMGNRTRALASAALSSSVWLVCKKRPADARPGWDARVLDEMRENITSRLREFWDAGIRGPDFVWAATGPAMEAYSKHPVVKKADQPGRLMEVSEFLRHVRRMVVDFVVGRVLSHDRGDEKAAGLDDVTTYYLLHRHDFRMEDAPAGPCILYAVSCGLTDGALIDQHDLLSKTGGSASRDEEETEGEEEAGEKDVEEGTGSMLKLKQWHQRRRPGMGLDPAVDSPRARAEASAQFLFPDLKPQPAPRREIPLIDQVHRLMHLWKAGELVKVDDYLDSRALLRNNTFHQVMQALIELAQAGSEERSILESISNHLKSRGVSVEDRQHSLSFRSKSKDTEGK